MNENKMEEVMAIMKRYYHDLYARNYEQAEVNRVKMVDLLYELGEIENEVFKTQFIDTIRKINGITL